MSSEGVITPSATLTIQVRGESAQAKAFKEGVGGLDLNQGLGRSFYVNSEVAEFSASVTASISEDQTSSQLRVKFDNLSSFTAENFQIDGLVTLRAGYEDSERSPQSVIFWGFLDYVIPTTSATDTKYELVATFQPFDLDNLRFPFTLEEPISASNLLRKLFSSFGATLALNDVMKDAANVKVEPSDYTSKGTIMEEITSVIEILKSELGAQLVLVPSQGNFKEYQLVSLNGSYELEFIEISVSKQNAYSAGPKPVRVKSEMPQIIGIGPKKRWDGRPPRTIDGDSTLMLEYSLSVPLDPEIWLGKLILVKGRKIPGIDKVEITRGRGDSSVYPFRATDIVHTINRTTFSSTASGPMLGPDFNSAVTI